MPEHKWPASKEIMSRLSQAGSGVIVNTLRKYRPNAFVNFKLKNDADALVLKDPDNSGTTYFVTQQTGIIQLRFEGNNLLLNNLIGAENNKPKIDFDYLFELCIEKGWDGSIDVSHKRSLIDYLPISGMGETRCVIAPIDYHDEDSATTFIDRTIEVEEAEAKLEQETSAAGKQKSRRTKK